MASIPLFETAVPHPGGGSLTPVAASIDNQATYQLYPVPLDTNDEAYSRGLTWAKAMYESFWLIFERPGLFIAYRADAFAGGGGLSRDAVFWYLRGEGKIGVFTPPKEVDGQIEIGHFHENCSLVEGLCLSGIEITLMVSASAVLVAVPKPERERYIALIRELRVAKHRLGRKWLDVELIYGITEFDAGTCLLLAFDAEFHLHEGEATKNARSAGRKLVFEPGLLTAER